MSLQALSFMLAAGLLAVVPGAARAQAPTHEHNSACCKTAAPCCQTAMATCCTQQDDAIPIQLVVNRQEPPTRQTMTVWFQRPVKIADRILFGQYVIEHDNVRMARGQPCTYIYEASDQRLPVVAFHCTHLKRTRSDHPTVWLQPLGEANGMMAFTEFQFAGEAAGHGVPAGR